MGRPILFRHARAGRGGEPFELLKLRTMRPLRDGRGGPDSDGARITPLGRFLRATSIDELPSLVNVLRGDMASSVRGRCRVRYLDRYTTVSAAGSTSARASPAGRRSTAATPSAGTAAGAGRWYVDHRSLALDLRIMAATVPSCCGRRRDRRDGHATMAELPAATRP